jgi:hypothetical protein
MLKQFTTSFPDGTAVHWRSLTWGEYRKLTDTYPPEHGPASFHLYDAVAGLCVIDFECPIAQTFDDLPAGVIASVADLILVETGFIPTEELVQKQIDAARQRVGRNYYHTAVAHICAVFHYKPHEVDELTIEEFMDLLAMAEAYTHSVAQGGAIDISLPKEEEEKIQYQEVVDQRTGRVIRVPMTHKNVKQSKIEILDGPKRQ